MLEDLAPLKRQVARKLGRVFETTRLLDLNRADSEFRKRAPAPGSDPAEVYGEVYYVLDTNVIQSFLQPKFWSKTSRLFHDAIWPPSNLENERNYTKLIEWVRAQSTLLATEFILSPEMNGAKNCVYMSLPHYAEMASQLSFLEQDLAKAFARGGPQDIKSRNRDIQALASLSERDPEYVVETMNRDPSFLRYGDTKLESLPPAKFDRIRDLYVVSSICRILADDEIVEPMDQVDRLGQDELFNRIRPIEWEFEGVDLNRESVAKETAFWLRMLQEGFARREVSKLQGRARSQTGPSPEEETKNKREMESLEADAQTLGHLMWLSRNVIGAQQRIVFVTGDRLILDVYRRWYSEHGEGTSFLLRPLALYGPQFNLYDAKSRVGREIEIFERTRRALEASTLPLVFSLTESFQSKDSGRSGRTASARARDRFCVDVQETGGEAALDALGGLTDHLPSLRRKADELDSMADALRWTERLAVGATPRLVRKRVDKAITRSREIFEMMERVSETASNSIIAEWFGEKLDIAMLHGFNFSTPLAVDKILQLGKQRREERPRAELGLRIGFPLGTENVSAVDWLAALERSATPADLVEALASRPALIFALASWLAFRHDLWSDAAKFADIASRAAHQEMKNRVGGWPDSRKVHDECLYLKAVSLRFRMASEEPTADHDADVWWRDLKGAEEALTTCIDDHQRHDETLRRLRAVSERAAVRLTYCAWAAYGSLGTLRIYRQPTNPHARIDLQGLFAGAVQDLTTCWNEFRQPAVEKDEAKPDTFGRAETREWVSKQLHVNPECARVLYDALLEPIDPEQKGYLVRTATVEDALRRMPWNRNRSTEGEHPVLRLYEIAAELRENRADALPDLSARLDAVESKGVALIIDRKMLERLRYLIQKRSR